MIGITLLAIAIVALAMGIMAIGLLFARPALRGSCGALGASGDALNCDTCPLRRVTGRPRCDDPAAPSAETPVRPPE